MYKITLTEREKHWLEEIVEVAPTSTEKLDILKKLANPLMSHE